MLDRAYELLPEQLEEQDRFQIPRARVTQQGRRSSDAEPRPAQRSSICPPIRRRRVN